MEMTEYDAFFCTVLKTLRSHLSTPETERFLVAVIQTLISVEIINFIRPKTRSK